MAMAKGVVRRRQQILRMLSDGPASAEDLCRRLRPAACLRTIAGDLAWLARRLPDQVVRERGGDARRVAWRLDGLPPSLLDPALDLLTHDELAALITARGLLRAPEARNPGWERPATPYAGDLSRALHGLLARSGLAQEARAIAPAAIGVSRFGVAPTAPGALAALSRLLATGGAAVFRYRNRRGDEREVHVEPMRLVLIKGEWFCFAWTPQGLRQYALARITSRNPAVRAARPVPGRPPRLPHEAVDDALANGFHATGGGPRVRVRLAVGPQAWPFIAERAWGDGQVIETAADLPAEWRRLSFTTSGLDECRHWVLSFGAAVRAEAPADLIAWLRSQAEALVSALPPMAATPVAGTCATLPLNAPPP